MAGMVCMKSRAGLMMALKVLLYAAMMPSGIPVATVAIDGGKNAALLAAEILALSDEDLAQALIARRKSEAEAVLAKDKNIADRL